MRVRGILLEGMDPMSNSVEGREKGLLTHPNENARYLKNKIEFCVARDIAGSFCSLKRLRFQL